MYILTNLVSLTPESDMIFMHSESGMHFRPNFGQSRDMTWDVSDIDVQDTEV